MLRSEDIRGLTRRRLLAGGSAAGAALAFGVRPWSPADAKAADVPDYLGRSSYLNLSTQTFVASGTKLTLQGVADLDERLAGSEDAFSLRFASDAPFDAGIRSFSHPDLGTFDFFVSPVEGNGTYEVVVNRSVNAPKHVPRQKQVTAKQPIAEPRQRGHVRKLSARRTARGVVCDIALTEDMNLKSATVWLTRGGLPAAAATVRHVHGKRVAVQIKTGHRLRGGRYELTVATKDRHGHTEYKRAPIVLQ